jgi:hypothetical protein
LPAGACAGAAGRCCFVTRPIAQINSIIHNPVMNVNHVGDRSQPSTRLLLFRAERHAKCRIADSPPDFRQALRDFRTLRGVRRV